MRASTITAAVAVLTLAVATGCTASTSEGPIRTATVVVSVPIQVPATSVVTETVEVESNELGEIDSPNSRRNKHFISLLDAYGFVYSDQHNVIMLGIGVCFEHSGQGVLSEEAMTRDQLVQHYQEAGWSLEMAEFFVDTALEVYCNA